MAFHDVRLPVDVERGAEGGPRWNTTVFATSSGFEKRNINWSLTRHGWDIGYGMQLKTDFEAVRDFFIARRGRAHSFRFKDWGDFEMARQVIGQNDGVTTDFQIYKRYDPAGLGQYDRNLVLPVENTAQCWVNSIAVTVVYNNPTPASGNVSIDTNTGILKLGATLAGASGQDIEVLTEFDTPVRFDVDEFSLALEWYNAGQIPSLPIIEVRGEVV